MKAKSWVACFVAALAVLLAGCAATTPPPSATRTEPGKAQITVLYDAFGKSSAMQKDWGYAALIEYGGKRVLFDTGNNSDILAQNARRRASISQTSTSSSCRTATAITWAAWPIS